MNNAPDYYRILHVQPDAPVAVIKASYRTLMTTLDMHPDRGGDHEKAALINEAYAVLSNPGKRRCYDESLLRQRGKPTREEHTHNSNSFDARQRNFVYVYGNSDHEYQGRRPSSEHFCFFCNTPHGYGDVVPPETRCSRCRSPLSHALEARNVHSGRRKLDRIDIDQPLHLYARWPQERPIAISLQDFSPDGLQFRCDQAVELDRVVKISNLVLDAVARIVYCRNAGSGCSHFVVGARFITLGFRNSCGTFVSATT